MRRIILFSLGVFIFLSPVYGGDRISLNGYYKSFFIGFQPPDYQSQMEIAFANPPLGAVNNRLRLKLSLNPAGWLRAEIAYDFSPRIQDPQLFAESPFFTDLESFSYRYDDFPARIYPKSNEPVSSFGMFHNLDRLFVTLKTGFADIFIGRQAIAWGSAYVINPTDVVAPFAFNELDTEERRGVDALRLRFPLGTMDELDVGYIFGQEGKFANSAFYLRGKFYLLKTDLSLLFMGFRENLLLGLDAARAIGGAGFRIEAAYVSPDFFNTGERERKNEPAYLRASVGLDYNFSSKTYGFIEYHYNSAGKSRAQDYLAYFQSTAFQEGTAYLLGQHYLAVGLTYQVSSLVPFTAMVLYNLSDHSFSLSPNLEYNIAENIYLSAGAYLGIGKNPELISLPPGQLGTLFHSEFGAYPHMVYTAFRIYF